MTVIIKRGFFITGLSLKGMLYAYVRVSTESQSDSGQRFEIHNWADKHSLQIDKWVSESVSGTVSENKRKLGRLISRLSRGDIIVCTEISRLGRNMLMIMSILNRCAAKGVGIRTIKDNFTLDDNINSKIIAFAFALAAEIERNLISQRTKEALADRKAAGVVLGRPRGSYKNIKQVREDLPGIEARIASGESLANIAKEYNIHRNTLVRYLKSMH